MAEKSIIIIGAGISGLSAGCYAQMNGYSSTIFELHDKPGGLCTSWKRRGYTIDGCIHWLVGSSSKSYMNKIWRELGALAGKEIVNYTEYSRFVGEDGREFIVYTDIDQLVRHMQKLSPPDAHIIHTMGKVLRSLTLLDQPVEEKRGIARLLAYIPGFLAILPAIVNLVKYSKTSVQDYAKRFQDPLLREAIPKLFLDSPDFPLLFILFTLCWMHQHDAGYPIGGSLAFARAIENRYLALGGEIRYKSRVERILVQGNRAVGVRLTDGREFRADCVISAADGHSTIFDMLQGKYVDDKILGYYKDFTPFPPLIQVALGIRRDLSDTPHVVDFPLAEPLIFAGQAYRRLRYKHYCFDPTLAPAGRSVVIFLLPTKYEYWTELYQDRQRYLAEKKQIASAVIAQLETRFPGISKDVEMVDVATPVTYERYTANWRASFEGWLITTKNMRTKMPMVLPQLSDFYMIGQWINPGGGLPPEAMSGKKVVQEICKRERRKFVSDKGI
jgi:phytoene dehydrogenase-like protein